MNDKIKIKCGRWAVIHDSDKIGVLLRDHKTGNATPLDPQGFYTLRRALEKMYDALAEAVDAPVGSE